MKAQVEKIIREAGGILMKHFGKTTAGRDKLYKGDVESVADLETEACIVDGLQAVFPKDAILTEEHPTEYLNSKAMREAGKERLWIIDALDGSRNFLRGISNFGISIAFIQEDTPRFGMVYLPGQEELYLAEAGKGALLNGTRITAALEEGIDRMFGSMFFGPRDTTADKNGILARYEQRRAWMVNPGPFVTAACYVARGSLDAGIWTGMCVWDSAACGLILQEAGAKVTDLKGNPWHWAADSQDIVAANPILHGKILKQIIGI